MCRGSNKCTQTQGRSPHWWPSHEESNVTSHPFIGRAMTDIGRSNQIADNWHTEWCPRVMTWVRFAECVGVHGYCLRVGRVMAVGWLLI